MEQDIQALRPPVSQSLRAAGRELRKAAGEAADTAKPLGAGAMTLVGEGPCGSFGEG